jgi:hypothetical protein
VLTSGDEVIALVDWEEAHHDWPVWDLANAVGTFCDDGDGLDPAAVAAFVAAYRDAGGTAPARHDDLVVPLVGVKRTLEILRAPTDRDPVWPLQIRNAKSLARLAV